MAEEYIKRSYVLKCILESRDGIDWGQSEDGDAFLHYSACLYRTIASNECFPSADVAEVKHGKWIPQDGYDGDIYWDCSNCGESWTTIDGEPFDNGMNYCPKCGARMDGE